MFSVTAYPDGARVTYRDIWQRRILLLILVKPDDPGNADYLASLRGTGADMPEDTSIVVTTDEIPGLPSPAAVVADQWGEIYSLTPAPSAASLPPATELADWVRFVTSPFRNPPPGFSRRRSH
jgi:hypothetical protein